MERVVRRRELLPQPDASDERTKGALGAAARIGSSSFLHLHTDGNPIPR